MSRNDTIVIVPGARYPNSENPFIQSVIVKLLGLFNVIPSPTDTEEEWIRALENGNRQIIRFVWSGRASVHSVRKAARELASLIRKYPSVTVVSCSLGTQVALLATKRNNDIRKIVSLSGVYRRSDTPFPIIDIRSSDDPFANVFHAILNLFSLTSKPTQQIILEGIRHDEFGTDVLLQKGKFSGRNISDVIESFIDPSV
ncbi:MAG: hypothetical protein WCL23_01490 [Candidatus Moraniibacteriota bacterium]